MQVRARIIDGIVWLAVGVSLIGQAGFLVTMNWWPGESAVPTSLPPEVASAIVAIGFVTVGLGALTIGVRRLLTIRRAP
jgi:hypothetical protein